MGVTSTSMSPCPCKSADGGLSSDHLIAERSSPWKMPVTRGCGVTEVAADTVALTPHQPAVKRRGHARVSAGLRLTPRADPTSISPTATRAGGGKATEAQHCHHQSQLR